MGDVADGRITYLTAWRTQAGGVATAIWIDSARAAKTTEPLENMLTRMWLWDVEG